MLDLSTLDALTDRQLLIRLIVLLTSLVKVQVQHRERTPSSTACRNGPACSYRPRCWFNHAETPPAAPSPPATPRQAAQRPEDAPHANKPNRCLSSSQRSCPWLAGLMVGRSRLPPPCGTQKETFATANPFGAIAPRRRKRRAPVPRVNSTTPCPTFSSSSADDASSIDRKYRLTSRRKSKPSQDRLVDPPTSPRRSSTSSEWRNPPSSTSPTAEDTRTSEPRRQSPTPPPKYQPVDPPASSRKSSSSDVLSLRTSPTPFTSPPAQRLLRLSHNYDTVTFDEIRCLAANAPLRTKPSQDQPVDPPTSLRRSSSSGVQHMRTPATISISTPAQRLLRLSHNYDTVTFEDIRCLAATAPLCTTPPKDQPVETPSPLLLPFSTGWQPPDLPNATSTLNQFFIYAVRRPHAQEEVSDRFPLLFSTGWRPPDLPPTLPLH